MAKGELMWTDGHHRLVIGHSAYGTVDLVLEYQSTDAMGDPKWIKIDPDTDGAWKIISQLVNGLWQNYKNRISEIRDLESQISTTDELLKQAGIEIDYDEKKVVVLS